MMRYNPDLQPPSSRTMPGHSESAGKGQSGRSYRGARDCPSNLQPAMGSVFCAELDSQANASSQSQYPPPTEKSFSVPGERSTPEASDSTNAPLAESQGGLTTGLLHSQSPREIGDRTIQDLNHPLARTLDQVVDHGNGKSGGHHRGASREHGFNQPSPPVEAGFDKTKLDETDLDEQERGLLPVLQNLNFLKLWSGQVFSQLADKVYLVLMIALIASRFQSEGQTISGWVSSLMIAFTIPAVLFGSVAGVFVDHWRKRAVLVSTNLLRGLLVLSLPLLLWLVQDAEIFAGLPAGFLVLLVVTFLVSTLTQFFAPAEQAAIPLLVERKHLLSANSLYTMTMMASVIVGFALGDPLLELAGRILAPIASQISTDSDFGKELLVGGSYAIAGLILMLLKTKEKVPSDSDESLPDVWANIRDGLGYLKRQAHVRVAMIQLVILFSIFAALAVLAVRLAEVMPEIKSSQFGFLLAAGGMGMALGAVGVGQFGQRLSRAQLSLYGSIGMAASLAAVSFVAHHLFPTLPLLVVLGASAAIAGVPMQTAIQEETPEEMRGKVFGLQNNAINIALSLPLALAGVAEAFFGLQTVFIGLAVLALLGGILAWSISRTQFNQNAS